MDIVEILGFSAAICTTVAFVPQVIQTYKSRSAKDISLAMFMVLCLGLAQWLVFGIARGEMSIILANLVTLLLACIILYFKIRYK